MKVRIHNMGWEVFRQKCIGNGASEDQLRDLQIAFFAGGKSMLITVTQLADSLPETQACKVMDQVQGEINDFFDTLEAEGHKVP